MANEHFHVPVVYCLHAAVLCAMKRTRVRERAGEIASDLVNNFCGFSLQPVRCSFISYLMSKTFDGNR